MDEELIELDPMDEGVEEQPVTMLDAMQAANLVPALPANEVARIGGEAVAEYQIDLESCAEFHKRYDRAMDMAMQVKKPKTFPWANASNVIYPLLTEAAIQFQARAYPAIIDGESVGKGKVMGPDEDGAKRNRADRVAAYMNWQLLNDIPGWEEDTDRLLLRLPIIGCVMRKTWHDPLRNQVNSETITAKDFVVHYDTVSLERAPRFTQVLRYYPHEIEAFIRTEAWARVPYDGEDGSDPHSLVEIYEQCRLIDMDDDGLPEPYVVTVTPDGHVARIVACYDAEGVYVFAPPMTAPMALAELMAANVSEDQLDWDSLKTVRIERKEYFTKYGFIPNPDGSFYDLGFGTLTDGLGAAVNTIINQLIDAGTLSNMQGGFLGGGTKLRGGNMRFTPGEWKRVEGVSGSSLRDNILPLQLPGPSPVLFQLLGMLVDAVKSITSVSDILSGNQETQTAPTTALALIEQGQKVFTAIYQRIHRALGQELKAIYRLNRDYIDEERYFAFGEDQQVVGRADFEDKDLDIVPVSDPRAINDKVKLAKAEILAQHNGDPLVNQIEIRKRGFEAAGIENIEALLEVPQPPPDPLVMAEAAKAEADVRSKDAATAKALIEGARAAYELGMVMQDPGIVAQAQAMLDDAVQLADKINQEMQGGEQVDGPGGVPEVGGEPADGGIPGLPAGLPGPTGDGMGQGGEPVPAGPM